MGTEVLRPHDCLRPGDEKRREGSADGLAMGRVRILKREEALESARNPDPDPAADAYAGTAFAFSPSPRKLPLPRFSTKKDGYAAVNRLATEELRRLLGLE